jgi:polyhydroxybutyrate depolymerase
MNRILAAALALLFAMPALAMGDRPKPRPEPPPAPVPVFTDPAVVTLGDRRFIFAGPGVPATVTDSKPVLVYLHGGGGDADRNVDANRLQDAARASGFIIVWPDSSDGNWRDGRPGYESDMDVVFIRDVIAWLVENANADLSRVYFTGFSNGGAMTHRMACEAADLVAGAAPVSSAPSHELAASCAPSRPVPFLVIQGTLPPISGGAGQEATADSVARWSATNTCGPAASSALPDVEPADGTTTTRHVYPCSGAPLEWYEVQGGGHTWAGNPPSSGPMGARMGPTSQDFDATAVMVDFFGLRR